MSDVFGTFGAGQKKGSELWQWSPSLREKIGNAVYDVFGAMGLPSISNRARNDAQSIVDFIPGVGDAVGFDDAGRDLSAGRYGQGAAGLGLSAIGLIPGAGDVAAGVGRRATNYLRDLGNEIPTLFRDMNAERALTFMQPGGLGGPFGQQELYWSNVPELAKGQHGNTGIKFKMDAKGVEGLDDVKSKPGAQFVAATSGGKEYVSRGGVDFSKVQEVSVDPSVMFQGTPDDRLFVRKMNELVNAGEFVAESPDGFIQIYRRVGKQTRAAK